MTPSRRSRPPRTWQVETLEERALLTAAYGPASFVPPTAATMSVGRLETRFNEFSGLEGSRLTVYRDFGPILTQAQPPILTQTLSQPVDFRIRSPFDLWSNSVSNTAEPSPIMIAGGVAHSIEPAEPIRLGDSTAPSYFAISMRGLLPLIRGFPAFPPYFFRQREDSTDGPARFGHHPFIAISPGSAWDDSLLDDTNELDEATSNRTDRRSENHEESSSGTGVTTLLAPAAGTATSSVMIWADPDKWDNNVTLTSLLLNPGDFDFGALIPHDDLPEATDALASLLDALIGEMVEFPTPFEASLTQITTLDPLDESSLALTATLLTVSSPTHTAATAGPGPLAETSATSGSQTEAEMPETLIPTAPSWAGFVIGLDEAFEANRLAARRWPAADAPASKQRHPETSMPVTSASAEEAAIDAVIQEHDQEASSSPLLDELFRHVRNEADREVDDEATLPDASLLDAIPAASLGLAFLSVVWEGKPGSARARLRIAIPQDESRVR